MCLGGLVVAGARFAGYLGQPAAQQRVYGAAKLAIKLSDPAIDESSGVARSSKYPGRYYTHNDSGDKPRFWRFDLNGKLEGPWELQGAKAIDWEDMASSEVGGRKYVYVADIGDNAEKRASVQIYRLEEPVGTAGEVSRFDTFELTYPDKEHNAEALLVFPGSGEMQIVTKAESGESLVFSLEGSAKPGKHTLKKLGSIKFASPLPGGQLVTGGDVSADGKYVALRTYLQGFEFDASKSSTWFQGKRRAVPLALEPQGEAIGYSLDGKMLVTTSEHSPCQVSIVAVKQ